MNKPQELIFRISFFQNEQIYEIYAKHVGESSMFGFIEIEEIVFGETTSVVVDPSEERLRNEFQGIKRTYLPMHNILRIDEVESQGAAKIVDVDSKDNVSHFPRANYVKPTDTSGH